MDVSRAKLLSAGEADRLLVYLRERVRDAGGRDLRVAQLDEVIVAALLCSGLRNSEFCALTLADTIVGGGASAFAVRGRSGRERTVYVPRRVSGLVLQYVEEIRPGLLPPEVGPEDLGQPLIFNERRRPYERTGLYRRVVRILTEAGVGDRASVQLLRHTYGYLAYLRTGGNLLFVQRQLGHAHPRITSVYAQFVDESYPELAERVGATGPTGVAHERVGRRARPPELDWEID